MTTKVKNEEDHCMHACMQSTVMHKAWQENTARGRDELEEEEQRREARRLLLVQQRCFNGRHLHGVSICDYKDMIAQSSVRTRAPQYAVGLSWSPLSATLSTTAASTAHDS